MEKEFQRTAMLLGNPALNTLLASKVCVVGIGGVGGYVVEALARSGVGELHLVDSDRVDATNLNRQLVALHSTIGQYKVDVAQQRILDIHPKCIVKTHKMFYLPETADAVDLSKMDYVVDCVDTVKAKIHLIKQCRLLGVPLICSMGAANKMDPTAFRVDDIEKTTMDPLAKVIRKKLRQLGVRGQKVVWSPEPPLAPLSTSDDGQRLPASNAFVPPAAGLVIASEVVKDLLRKNHTYRIPPEEEANNPYAREAAAKAGKWTQGGTENA